MNAARIEVSTMSAPDAFELLITPQEAVEFSRFRTIKDLDVCLDILDAFKVSCRLAGAGNYRYWFYRLLGTVWNAGRIQGIRSERLRRKQNIEQ